MTSGLIVGPDGTQAKGNLAVRFLQSGGDPRVLRTADVLTYDQWKEIDRTVVQIGRERIGALGDFISRGLTYNLTNALGKTMLQWQAISDLERARVDMSGITMGDNERLLFGTRFLPLPITHKEFQYNIRHLAASRNGPNAEPLDTLHIEAATIKVNEENEYTLFNGAEVEDSGAKVYGLLTHPDRNQGVMTVNWATATGAQMLADLLAMKAVSIADRYYGPWGLYVSSDIDPRFDEDYKVNIAGNIRSRLQAVDGLQFIRVSDQMPPGTAVLVCLQRSCIDIVVGMLPTPISWEERAGMITFFEVMSIIVPRIKSDKALRSGIVHYRAP